LTYLNGLRPTIDILSEPIEVDNITIVELANKKELFIVSTTYQPSPDITPIKISWIDTDDRNRLSPWHQTDTIREYRDQMRESGWMAPAIAPALMHIVPGVYAPTVGSALVGKAISLVSPLHEFGRLNVYEQGSKVVSVTNSEIFAYAPCR
jgi:hypothetical protein